MRSLPGRASRTSVDSAAGVTRDGVNEDQRQRILNATNELVAESGYNALTVELIAKRAKVSFKTFYKHFPNKEACFLELFDSKIALSRERIEAALAAEPDAPWPQQVVVAVRALFEAILIDPLSARATIVEAPTAGPVIIDRYQSAINGLSPLLQHGREFSPDAEDLPETLEQTLVGGVLWSAYQRLIVGEDDRIEALLPEAIEFLLRPYVGDAEAARWAKFSPQQASAPEHAPAAS
jgi:AcrR family transcriptional regulator